jgi:hypothetical protein
MMDIETHLSVVTVYKETINALQEALGNEKKESSKLLCKILQLEQVNEDRVREIKMLQQSKHDADALRKTCAELRRQISLYRLIDPYPQVATEQREKRELSAERDRLKERNAWQASQLLLLTRKLQQVGDVIRD